MTPLVSDKNGFVYNDTATVISGNTVFESLTDRLSSTFAVLTGKAKLTEDNIQDALREVRVALLEADVALSVAKDFIDQVKLRALGEEVTASLSPGQVFIKIVNDELTAIMGEGESGLNLNVQPPMVILMAGLQGAGKTTSTAKLGHWLKNREKKSVNIFGRSRLCPNGDI